MRVRTCMESLTSMDLYSTFVPEIETAFLLVTAHLGCLFSPSAYNLQPALEVPVCLFVCLSTALASYVRFSDLLLTYK